ncbi:unnamed protein product [Paramecium octaurelia]|uniref:Zinc transporter n=1 Tax=Paramecium octaurelia TaxID=43137 RepID=A0A8S1XVX2_PAROT|nr:unnamed protein product [Paramecium octaurelia]
MEKTEAETFKQPLINETGQQFSVRSKQTRKNSQLSILTEHSKMDTHLYEIPDLTQITQKVLCRLIVVSVVCIIFLVAEVIGGLWAQSLAILSDAAHMFSDMSGFFISIFSIWLGQRPASQKMSFGYHRAEVIGALGSIILIWGLTILLFYEATVRVIEEAIVTDPLIMLITAGFGLFCNLVMAKVLHSSPTGGHDHGNIMHQCSGHNHGHGHDHDHSHGSDDGHSHDKQKQQKKKKKISIKQKRQQVSENGISMLVVEQSIESESSEQNLTIKEESESSSSCTSNQQQDLGQKQKQQSREHNHSENCGHDHQQITITPEIDDQKLQKSQKKKVTKEGDHNSCHGKEHNHEHEHEHKHDHKHDHNHDHNHKSKKNKLKSKNLTEINEHDNYNLKAAMIHVIGDILQSIGVLIAAFLIYFFGQKRDENNQIVFTYWQYADPLCTYLFSILVLFTTFGVARECLRVLMEGTPQNLIIDEFSDQLKAIHRVKEVHDLHIWSLSVGKPAMSAHIVCIENPEYVLRKATKLCRQFGIYHSTIQIELYDRQGANDYIRCNHNIHK